MNRADRAYNRVGLTEPYCGVITLDRFLSANLDAATLHEFFETGEAQVAHVLETIRARLDATSGRSGCSILAAASAGC
jgi:hypothetical protein